MVLKIYSNTRSTRNHVENTFWTISIGSGSLHKKKFILKYRIVHVYITYIVGTVRDLI